MIKMIISFIRNTLQKEKKNYTVGLQMGTPCEKMGLRCMLTDSTMYWIQIIPLITLRLKSGVLCWVKTCRVKPGI